MSFVLAAAMFSVLVSVLLKLMPRHRIDVAQAVTWNYLAASALCVWWLDPPLARLDSPGTPWLALLALAVILPSLFLVLANAVRQAGIVRTDIAQRLSLLLSLIAAFTVFSEPAGTMKLLGLGLGLVAIVAILARPTTNATATRHTLVWLLTVWVGFAVVDVALKFIARAGTPFSASLTVSFALAFAGMLAVQWWRQWRGRARLSVHNLAAGLLLGALNFGNIICYVRAHQVLPDSPAVVFATMNIGVVVLGTLTGVLVFSEPTSRWNRIGIVLAIAAIAVIAMAPRS
ncbi:MAG TPA: EamA family transporter [Chiayiivirga sp.]|nr:EamA family transporter [Chiayiivirga sp.]